MAINLYFARKKHFAFHILTQNINYCVGKGPSFGRQGILNRIHTCSRAQGFLYNRVIISMPSLASRLGWAGSGLPELLRIGLEFYLITQSRSAEADPNQSRTGPKYSGVGYGLKFLPDKIFGSDMDRTKLIPNPTYI